MRASSSSLRGVACRGASAQIRSRQYNFASSQYNECFDRAGMPDPDVAKLRQDAIEYLDGFDAQVWYDKPQVTLLKGEVLAGGNSADTVDAFGRVNGRAVHATAAEVDAAIAHMLEYKPPKVDYRAEIRKVEQDIFENYSGLLIGNQAVDFKKQDGVTEIEESLQANLVERRLNDQLLEDELAGRIEINRAPAYVGCVSNFSNFLDLSRKTLRNLELGVPVIILSRSNTTQHMFRWSEVLVELLAKHSIDSGMVTFLSASLPEQQRLFQEGPKDSPMYFTGSREVAGELCKQIGSVMASTGGPNTLVATRWLE